MSWPTTSIESIAASNKYACVGGPFGSKLTGKDYVPEGIPVIRGANMGERFISNDDFVFVTESKVNKDLSGNLAYPGDVVFTQRGTLGQVSLVPENAKFDKYVVSQSQMKLTVDKNKADAKFIYYYFSSRETVGKILNYVSSSGVPHINLTVLRKFEIPLPKLEQQKEIAETLSTYDDLIENNKRRIALLEESARQLYKEWFVRFRFPGHEHVKIVDGVPEGWRSKKVGELLAQVKRPGKIKKDDYLEMGEFPCIDQSQSFVGGYTDLKDAVVQEPLPLVVFGDHTRILKFIDFPFACGADGTQLLYPNDEKISIEYFYFSLVAIDLSNYFYARHFKFLKDQIVLIPSEVLINSFTDFSKYNMKQISKLRNQNHELSQARDLLLPKLMNGEIVV